MRKSEIIKQRDRAIARSKSILELNDCILALNNKVTDAYIKSVEKNEELRKDICKIREHAKSVIDENNKLREQVRKLERKHTSFQEDLEFFVNDCTEAQARELYERLKKRFDNGPHVLCKDGTKARVGDEVQVITSTVSKMTSSIGSISSILFENGKCIRFDLNLEGGGYMRIWPDECHIRVFLLARREEKKNVR